MPALPQSIGASGSRRPSSPTPAMRSASGSSSTTATPSERTAARVDSVSSERPKPRTRVSPSLTAPTSSARWEIDLSPGTRSAPRMLTAGAISINRRDRRARAAPAPTRRPAMAARRCTSPALPSAARGEVSRREGSWAVHRRQPGRRVARARGSPRRRSPRLPCSPCRSAAAPRGRPARPIRPRRGAGSVATTGRCPARTGRRGTPSWMAIIAAPAWPGPG